MMTFYLIDEAFWLQAMFRLFFFSNTFHVYIMVSAFSKFFTVKMQITYIFSLICFLIKLSIWRLICRTAGVSTHTAEHQKKNLFLQSLYEEQDKSTVVNGRTVDKSEPQREYQDKDIVESLEKGVKFWTDFSKVHYHSQSLYELSGLWMDAWEFDNYGIGRDALSHGLQGEEISERLRFFVEECDRVQVWDIIPAILHCLEKRWDCIWYSLKS